MKYYILIVAVFFSIANVNAEKKEKTKKNKSKNSKISNNLISKTVADSIKKEENKQHLIHINKIMNSTVESDILSGISYFNNNKIKTEPAWIPRYYQAYGYLRLSYISEKKEFRPTYLASANNIITANSNEEFAILSAKFKLLDNKLNKQMINEVLSSLEYARNTNSENPRVYYLTAAFNNLLIKENPEKVEVAKNNVVKALEKFKTVDNSNPLLPNWGAEEATFLLENLGR
jgi:hypothetical protein